jgi:tetratricopeptide (TPR) repeat protein
MIPERLRSGWRWAGAAATVFGVLACTPTPDIPVPAQLQELSEPARLEYEAARSAVEAVGIPPRGAKARRAWGELGIWFHSHRYRAEAESTYRIAVDATPDVDRYDYLLAVLLAESGEPAEAAELFTATLAAAVPGSRLRLAEALLALGDFAAARTHARALIDTPAPLPAELAVAAAIELAAGDLQAGLPLARRAWEGQPDSRHLRQLYLDAARRAALPAPDLGSAPSSDLSPRRDDPLVQALELRGGSLRSIRARAAALEGAGKPHEAVDLLLTKSRQRGGDAGLELDAATRLLELKRPRRAIAILDAQAEPGASNRVLVGRAHLMLGDPEQAKKAWREALAFDPKHPRALLLLGHQALHEGDSGTALELAERAVAADPSQPGARILELVARLASRDLSTLEAARRHHQAFPADPILGHLRARMEATAGDPAAAVALARTTCEQEESEGCRHSLALALAALGNFTEAIAALPPTRLEDPEWVRRRRALLASHRLPPWPWEPGETLVRPIEGASE